MPCARLDYTAPAWLVREAHLVAGAGRSSNGTVLRAQAGAFAAAMPPESRLYADGALLALYPDNGWSPEEVAALFGE